MSTYDTMCSLPNLRRAYRWLNSNPDYRYKNLFRDSYAAYAISSDANLKALRKELLRHRYESTHASKILVPKPSGALRPITLLTVDDQIVYQACVNVIADVLKPRTIRRYRKRVFNHLYAGKSSRFFYLKWQDSYHAFGDEVRRLVKGGNNWVANFDLTSFYDTIDHHVLSHFLSELGIEKELIEFLMNCLRVWTSSTWTNSEPTIYHEHGIPQGPQPSGMLSEVVLTHIDATGERGRRTRYLRYVDDIKIFAKNETDLRQKLIALDICSKEVGLFPQTAKINIRRVSDPEDEIKSVSHPPEPSLSPFAEKEDVVKRLLELTRGGRVDPDFSTRFKYILARTTPSYRLNERLIRVLIHHPEYAENISHYFQRYRTIPNKAADAIVAFLKAPEIYHSVFGELLRAVLFNMPTSPRNEIADRCFDRLFRPPPGSLPLQPTYKEALIAWVVVWNRATFASFERLRRNEVDWWVRKSMLREIDVAKYGIPSYRQFLNDSMKTTEPEIARIAAAKIVEDAIPVNRPYGTAHIAAKTTLKTAGRIRSVGRPASLIPSALNYILRQRLARYDWQRYFGRHHKHAEYLAILSKQSFETDIDAFVMRLDSFCDFLFDEIYRRLCPGLARPTYGAALNSPSAPIRAMLPRTIVGFKALHDLRINSVSAHPKSQRTGIPTKRIKHSDYSRIRKNVVEAFVEIQGTIVP